MKQDVCNAYAARVAQANRSELVVIIYEAFIDSVKEGKEMMVQGNITECRREIKRARGFINELMGSLDLSYEISYYLRRLYIYAYQELCQGVALRETERFDHSLDIFEKLLPAFQNMANEDKSGPVMKNAESVYAGLTYNRTSLNETIGVDVNMNRGFQA